MSSERKTQPPKIVSLIAAIALALLPSTSASSLQSGFASGGFEPGIFAAPILGSDQDEFAPIVERKMRFYDFTMKSLDSREFNLRQYGADKRLLIVSFVAGWCQNSIRNGHVLKRLFDKYKARGVGVVGVTEYSTAEEVQIYVNRIGIDYPVVAETHTLQARKKSRHYKYRESLADRRKWGTPFYVIIDSRDVEPANSDGLLASRVYTVSGEIVEQEAERFIEQRLSAIEDR